MDRFSENVLSDLRALRRSRVANQNHKASAPYWVLAIGMMMLAILNT